MTDFRKWFLAFAVLVVMVGTAYADTYQCFANAGVPARVRGEERTALLGDLILNCTGDLPSEGAGLTANIQIFLSTNITSRIVDTTTGKTDAILTLNNPLPQYQRLDTTSGVIVPNVFSGIKAGDNSLLWLSVPLAVPAPPATTPVDEVRTFRITNVRANAVQAFSQGQTFIPQQITMFVTLYSSVSVAINNPTQVVGAVLKGLDFTTRRCNDEGSMSTAYGQCSSRGTTDAASTSHRLAGLLKYSEGFDGAFKQMISTAQNGAILGTVSASESGYLNTPVSVLGQANVAGTVSPYGLPSNYGTATSATRLIAKFANIPAGVSIFVTTRELLPSTTYYTTSPTTAALVSVSDLTGTGGSASFPLTATGAYDNSYSDIGGYSCSKAKNGDSAYGIIQVPLFGGAGAATWEILTSSSAVVEYISFGVMVEYSAAPQSNLPALTGSTPGTVAGNFAPISSDDKMSAVSPIPRFADLPILKTLVEINPCQTTLLFPFVTARGGFDTGIAISNTTLDNSKDLPGGTDKWPFETKAQAGFCKLMYVGDKEDGTSLAKPIQTSGVLAAGKQLVYTLFGGGSGIDATPGFQGYIIARCDFDLAHGFAFISDLGAQKLAMGYLALVLTKNSGARGGIESLSH
jgi:hypothetical protein